MALYLWISFIVLLSYHMISVSDGIPFQDNNINSTYSSNNRNGSGEIPEKSHHGIHIANWRWDEIGVFFTFTVFIVVSGLAKVAFHHVSSISEHVPESCLMIIVGISVGGIFYACGISPSKGEDKDDEDHLTFPTFTPRFFFFILLPPVVLEAAFSLYNRAFSYNLCTILLYAVVGTIFNTFTIGPLLYLLRYAGLMGAVPQSLPMLECLVFSALISAVDPVAVLAIFQEVGVNQDLYYLLFGESLLNDAVTIVLYSTIVTYCEMPQIPASDYGMAILAFFAVSLGGVFIGTLFGLGTALITKTTQNVRVVEPLAVLGIAYLSYLSAELFHWSGIISITTCGLVQAHYAARNISQKSYTTVKYFIKMLSSTCDSIIFLFLGMVLVSDRHVWHTGFVLWTLILCLVCRFIGVYLLTAAANKLRVRKIDLQEQFIMAYGGLRGAIAFSLVEMLDEETVHSRSMFVTTTLVVIIFTVFVQGSTIKPLVKLLNIATANKKKLTMADELNNNVVSTMMAGIEEITGLRGDYYIRMKLEHLDDTVLKKIFLRKSPENDLTRFYEKLCLVDHFAHLYGPATLVEDEKAKAINTSFIEDSTLPVMSSNKTTRSFSDLFPGVELRHETETSRRDSKIVSTDILRKAISSHSYNKFHQCYNPNLINDHYQELGDQLKMRHMKARRIANVASRLKRQISEIPSSTCLEEFAYPRRKIHSDLEGVYPQDVEGIDTILSRTGERILKQRSLSLSESSRHQQTPTSPNLPLTGLSSDVNKFLWPIEEQEKQINARESDSSEHDQMLQSLDKSDDVFVTEKSSDSKI